jgi:peptide/nickel transport system substrate-binding protein
VGSALAAAAAMGAYRISSASPASKHELLSNGFQEGDNVITIATLGDAQSINPFLTNESEGDWRCKMLFEQFVRVAPDTYAPTQGLGLAESWTLEDLTYTFTINANAKFSDGSDVTADDVAFTILGHLNPATGSPRQSKFTSIAGAEDYAGLSATPSATPVDSVSGLEVVDPKTLKITLATPDASFLFNLRYVFTVPKAQLEGKDLAADAWFQAPIGAGPFVFSSWNTGGDFVANKNPNYYQEGKPALDGFIHRVIADANTIVLSLQSGEIDGSVYPAPTLKDQLEQIEDVEILIPPFNSPNGWMFNLNNEWLAKKEVRQAIAMAINVEQYAADSLLGIGTPGVGPIAPGSWAFDPELKPLPYDPTAAKALLDSVGFPAGTKIRFCVNQGNVLREDWLVLSQQALKEIGIEVDAQLLEYATLVEDVTVNGDYDATGVDFAGVTADPGELYDQLLTGAAGNYMNYSNPALDDLLKQARVELDMEAAKALYKQIQAIVVDDVPDYFAWYRPFLHVINKRFTGYTGSNMEEGVFYTLEDWSLAV